MNSSKDILLGLKQVWKACLGLKLNLLDLESITVGLAWLSPLTICLGIQIEDTASICWFMNLAIGERPRARAPPSAPKRLTHPRDSRKPSGNTRECLYP